MAFLRNWMRVLANGIRDELYGWPMVFLGTLAICARNGYELCGWLVVFLKMLATCARKWV